MKIGSAVSSQPVLKSVQSASGSVLWNCDQEGSAAAASCFILAKMTATLHSLVPISSLLGSILAACDEIVLLIFRDSTPWSSLAWPLPLSP